MNANDTHPDRSDRAAVAGGKLIFGLALAGLGLFFLLDRLAVIDIRVPWGWWPLILVALGVSKLLDGGGTRHSQGGVWLIVIGLWLILNFEGYFGLDWDNSWPLLLIAAGAMIVWKSLAGDEGGHRHRHRHGRHRHRGGGGGGHEHALPAPERPGEVGDEG